MRLLEFASIASLIVCCACVVFTGYRYRLWLLAGVSLGFATVQLAFEGYRWQMVPAYFAFVVLAGYLSFSRSTSRRWSLCVGVVGLWLAFSAMYLSILFSIFSLPAPTGPYQVGKQSRHIVDRARRNSQNEGNYRELMIEVWYPVDRTVNGPIAPYRDWRDTNWRDWYMSMVPTYSILGAPVSRARAGFPVLLYSPAWAGRRNENTFHAQELASHGYIVVAIDHPYDSEFVVFPQGRVVHTRLVWGDPFSSETAERKFVSVAERQIRVRAEDAVLVLDTLAEINSSDASNTFSGKLDLNRVGIFGFSLGGGTALQACWLDRRFKAGIDMDGLIAAESAKDGPPVPFLFLIAEVPLELNASIKDPTERRRIAFDMRQIARMRELSGRSGVRVETLAGLSHFNFSDAHFYSPWPNPATAFGARVLRHFRFWPDSVRAESTARLISHHIRAFFDRHLKGMDSPWPAGARGEDP